ncbi:MAG: hypothetical protein ACRETI_04765 [Steroidobacteraceae bacterium]
MTRSARIGARAAAAVLVSIHVAWAAASDSAGAERLFHEGVQAFESGAYSEALKAFESARLAGLEGPAVHYNIGVAAFHLDDLDRAEAAFREVLKTPEMAPVARYNLGLVSQGRGDSTAADRWFAQAAATAGDERLRELAARQADRDRVAPDRRRHQGFLYAGAGHDSNVALINDEALIGISGLDDGFLSLLMAGSFSLDANWRLDGGLTLVDYQTLDRYDQQSANAGVRYQRRTSGDWLGEIGAGGVYALLDGEALESKGVVTLGVASPFRNGWQLRLRYRFSGIEGGDEFEGLTGNRHGVEARLVRSGAAGRIGLGYEFEDGDLEDPALSSTDNQLKLDAAWYLRPDWSLEFDATWRSSDYDEVEDDGDSSRTEDRIAFSAALARAFLERWRIVVRFGYLDNQSSIALYDFDAVRFTAGIEGVF